MNIKNQVIKELKEQSIDMTNYENLFSLCADSKNGEVTFPCFTLAKELKKSPQQIAEDICGQINAKTFATIKQAVAVNGYANIYLHKDVLAKEIVSNVLRLKQEFASDSFGAGQTVVLDYASPNLAKYMHIGHLKTTIIGLVMNNIYKNFGYQTVSINYVGDHGTPFGKMVTAIKLWSSVEEVKKGGVDAIQDLYIKFNQQAVDNPELDDQARAWFKKIEDGDKEACELSDFIIETCRAEVETLCEKLGARFDSWRGESYYSDKMGTVIDELKSKDLLQVSNGATVVNLEEYGLGIALIQKSDGSSLYLTRDLAAIQDRYDNYKFDKAVYVTDIAQKLHFNQLFKIIELLEKPYAGTLHHLAYGRYSMPDGKISSRLGKQALLKDLLAAAQEKSLEVMANRGTKVEEMQAVSEQVAKGALSFEATKLERVRDTVYDMEASLSFEGETSPYMQYTYARCCSIIEKACTAIDLEKADFSNIDSQSGLELIKLVNKLPQAVVDACNKQEPCLIVRCVMDICSEFNKFYAGNRIIDNEVVNMTNLAIVEMVKIAIAKGCELVNIPTIEKM